MKHKELVHYLNGLIEETQNGSGVSHETVNEIPEKIASDILTNDSRVSYFSFYDFVGCRKLYLETKNKKIPRSFTKRLKKYH